MTRWPAHASIASGAASRRRVMGRALRLLVVEDEAYVGLDIVGELHTHGIITIGPARSLDEALELVERETIDAAVLDIKLGNELSIAVADALSEQSIPFMFLTGYSTVYVPQRHRDRPFINKPY